MPARRKSWASRARQIYKAIGEKPRPFAYFPSQQYYFPVSVLTVRTAGRDLPEGPLEFEFAAADAVPVRRTSLTSSSPSNSEDAV